MEEIEEKFNPRGDATSPQRGSAVIESIIRKANVEKNVWPIIVGVGFVSFIMGFLIESNIENHKKERSQ